MPVVLGCDVGAEVVNPLRHRAGEPVDGGRLAEERLELARVGRGDRAGVERAESALELQRAGERRLHGYLLVEREPDQQRERILGDELVGLVVAREVQPIG